MSASPSGSSSGDLGPVAALERFVAAFALDVGRVRAALADDRTPGPARLTLVGALNYVLDGLDILPDHYPGLGIADDAIVLRLAALQAVGEGAEHRAVRQLAAQATDVERVLGELTGPLKTLVASLADRAVRGRTAAQILDSADARAVFEADLTRAIQRHESAPVAPIPGGETAVVEELRRMVRAALKKAGVAAV